MMFIAEIAVGDRHRKEMGDLTELAQSIADVGLLQPIAVCSDGTLIAGERRLRACREILGWTEIAARVVDLDEIARGEFAENVIRKNFTLSEIVAIKRRLEPKLKKEAAERRNPSGRVGKFPTQTGRAADHVARYVAKDRRTIDKAEAIVEAAEAEPDRFGKLRADMDRTGRVEATYRRLNVVRKAEAIRKEAPPLPGKGPYRVIVADPPWPYELRQEDPTHRAVYDYPSMSIAQICAMPVASIAHEDCILWLWTTNAHMCRVFSVLDAWGFAHKTILTWVKDRMGTGDWLRGQSEHCLMATRGKPTVQLTNQTTVLHGPVRAHSQKPEEFYEFVEKLCPASRYAELFSRHARENWDGHGDEIAAGMVAGGAR
jgi:N6-adenosine-specific RNA methylase IME4/ParB-like chromosome segregation protein Spo0J